MARVIFDHVWKRFGDTVAVRDLSLELPDGEFVVLVGPSGSGKSTAMRMVAGLDEISDGVIVIGNRVVNDLTPKERDIAMVFQSYALYPHMNVFDNLGYALRLRGFSKDEINSRVHEAARVLDIEELLARKPKELSGGQRQRVALGRAIVREPQVFLMDEPLSNLDAKLRVQTRAEIIKLHRRIGTTTIYVTHDQVEAMTMGDRIAVLNFGELQQFDTPKNLYNRPANVFVAGFIGSPSMNFFRMDLERRDGHLMMSGNGMSVRVPERVRSILEAGNHSSITLGIRPEHIETTVGDLPVSDGIMVDATVDVVELLGNEQFVYFDTGWDEQLIGRIPAEPPLDPGDKLQIILPADRLHFFDVETEQAIYQEDLAVSESPTAVNPGFRSRNNPPS
jgi:multiple sugar transport system ATP-binding protein